jgi:hypothetical protein
MGWWRNLFPLYLQQTLYSDSYQYNHSSLESSFRSICNDYFKQYKYKLFYYNKFVYYYFDIHIYFQYNQYFDQY